MEVSGEIVLNGLSFLHGRLCARLGGNTWIVRVALSGQGSMIMSGWTLVHAIHKHFICSVELGLCNDQWSWPGRQGCQQVQGVTIQVSIGVHWRNACCSCSNSQSRVWTGILGLYRGGGGFIFRGCTYLHHSEPRKGLFPSFAIYFYIVLSNKKEFQQNNHTTSG